jgi:hypothetical protein
MSPVRFEPTTPVCELAKTVHALDRTAIVIGCCLFLPLENTQYRCLVCISHGIIRHLTKTLHTQSTWTKQVTENINPLAYKITATQRPAVISVKDGSVNIQVLKQNYNILWQLHLYTLQRSYLKIVSVCPYIYIYIYKFRWQNKYSILKANAQCWWLCSAVFLSPYMYLRQEFRNSYSSPSIISMIKSRMMLWAGEKRNEYRILVRKLEGKPWRRWEDNIKTDLTEIVWGGGWLYGLD